MTAAAFPSTSTRRRRRARSRSSSPSLHAGGKFEHGNYKTAGGLHGVGASVVNALSKELVATVKRDGAQWEMRFKQGKPTGPLKKLGAARGSGTTVYFHPDATIFPKIEFDAAIISERLEVASYIHKGLKVTFEDEVDQGEDRLRAQRRHRRLSEEDRRRARRQARARAPFTLTRDERAAPRSRAAVDRGDRRARPLATSTASPPAQAARTRTDFAPASARRSATTSRRTIFRPKASR